MPVFFSDFEAFRGETGKKKVHFPVATFQVATGMSGCFLPEPFAKGFKIAKSTLMIYIFGKKLSTQFLLRVCLRQAVKIRS